MRQRFFYALAGAVVSLGAPLGLLGVRILQRRGSTRPLQFAAREIQADPVGYVYIASATAAAFTTFGFLIGRQADQLATLSETDALTGLNNARGLTKRLQQEVARFRRYREPLAVLLIDLDDLKRINDRYGHRIGDVAIRDVAAAIRAELRASDIAARWGGDEFAILAPSTSELAARALAERIRTLLDRRHGPAHPTVSIGVAALDSTADRARSDADALMLIADSALYEAKNRGRNTVVMDTRGSATHPWAAR
jgi:diguanylate cyclase (GGDEF)-like protein